MENSTVKQDKLSEVLNKSNVMVLVMFLAIYFIIYFLMDVFNKEKTSGEQKDIRMSKLLDIMVFSFVLIYLVCKCFFSETIVSKKKIWMYTESEYQ